MRPRTIILFLAGIASYGTQANADKWDEMLFIPARNGESAQIIDEAGKIRSVIEGMMGARPLDCPPSTYWSYDPLPEASKAARIVSCDDENEAYQLKQTPESVMKGGFVLVPATDPRPPGTDDPGPSTGNPVSTPEVTP